MEPVAAKDDETERLRRPTSAAWASPDGRKWATNPGRLATRPLDQLRPHPSYARHCLTVSADRLSALASLGENAFRDPLLVTRDGLILDGYVRWELARKQGRSTLQCIELDLTEAEGLHWLLQRHRRTNGLSDFSRILLALDLEPWFRERAWANQRAGGQGKGSSKLTEAQRVDVRQEIASAAGVSVGNVSKAKQILATASAELQQALRSGEVRIHRAWSWCRLSPSEQREALRRYQSMRVVGKIIRTLIARHSEKDSPVVVDKSDLANLVSGLESGMLAGVQLHVIDTPGMAVFLTRDLVHNLRSQRELRL